MIRFDTGWGRLQAHYRALRAISLRRLAQLTGLSVTTLNGYELGNGEPSWHSVIVLVAALNIPRARVWPALPATLECMYRELYPPKAAGGPTPQAKKAKGGAT